MRKITLICLMCLLTVILTVFVSCDDVEATKSALEGFQSEVAFIEKTHNFDDGVEIYEIKFTDGTAQTLEIKNETDVTVKSAELDDVGNLIITMSDNTVKNLGKFVGEAGENGEKGNKGDKGQKGSDGKDGRSIDRINISDTSLTIFYTDNTSQTISDVYEEDSWSIVYEDFKKKYPSYNGTEEDFVTDIVANLLLTTEYTVKFYINGTDVNIPEQKVLWGEKVDEVTAPTKTGYEFLGWYVGDDKWSFIGCTVTDDITLDGRYRRLSCEESPQGFHTYETVETEATCIKAGTKKSTCSVCGATSQDMIYSTMHPALGHKWVEDGETGDGWVLATDFQRTRECLREGCDKVETQECANVTTSATITVSSEAGGYPTISDWPAYLTDGDWDTQAVAPKTGSSLEIELDFSGVTSVNADFIAFSASGKGDEGDYSAYRVLVTYSGDEDATLIASDKLGASSNTKDTAIVIDLGENNENIVKIEIIFDAPTSEDHFYEILVGKYVTEE